MAAVCHDPHAQASLLLQVRGGRCAFLRRSGFLPKPRPTAAPDDGPNRPRCTAVTDTRSEAPTSLPAICLVGASGARPFSQSSHERLRRMFARVGITDVRDEGEELPSQGRVVLLRADHVLDDALARPLVERHGIALTA